MEIEPKFVLETLQGPESYSLQLKGGEPITIGRGAENSLPLPTGATVSRNHAQLTLFDSKTDPFWKLEDMGSRHGTFLNGIKLKEGQGVRLRSGDLITIEPFTFQVVDHNEDNKFTETFDDAKSVGGTSILRIDRTQGGAGLAHERLQALLECSRIIHTAETEHEMAEALATAASAGTAF